MPFGRNRESRSREAAGRRNWPEAVPKKMRCRKRLCAEMRETPNESEDRVSFVLSWGHWEKPLLR